MNYSWQRQLILETVQKSKQHMTAAQVYQLARKNCPHLSLGTVYRNLNLLVDIGQLRRIGVPGEADRYDWQLETHQHLFCRRCKKVLNLAMQSDALEAACTKLPRHPGRGLQLHCDGPLPGLQAAPRCAGRCLRQFLSYTTPPYSIAPPLPKRGRFFTEILRALYRNLLCGGQGLPI